MQELINFSTYSIDTERFGNDWQAIATYTHQFDGIAGLELLLGYEPPPPAIPAGLVRAVHLPFWITWLDVWRAGEAGLARYFPDIDRQWLQFYCGGPNRAAMIATQRQLWLNAASLNPAYAVFHVSHVEAADVFTRQYHYTDFDVIEATADLLNAVAATFPGGEPPVRLFFENLGWPGLTFIATEPAEWLAERLTFDNWAFVLDTGHLMTTTPQVVTEDQGIDYVLHAIESLSPAVRRRIEGVHFHCSLSGDYHQEQLKAGLPAGFYNLSLAERRGLANLHAMRLDEHRPFTQPRCRAIIEAIQPHFLTHEFLSETQVEYDQKLAMQRAAFWS